METRTTFHKEIREIQDEILIMGSMVNKAILQAIAALQNRDLTQAKQVIADDQKINHKSIIERHSTGGIACIRLTQTWTMCKFSQILITIV